MTTRTVASQTTEPAAVQWALWSTTARLVVTSPALLPSARAIADEVLAGIELAASRFRDDSEISSLAAASSRAARAGAVSCEHEVSPVLADLLTAALDAAELTAGAVDPTVGRAMEALGYDRDLALVQSVDGPLRAVVGRVPGWRTLHLTGDRLRLPSGVALDLGATAKAVAADRVAARVAAELGTGVLVCLGGDLATAGASPAGGWQVLVQDTPADPAAHLALRHGAAVATSSTVRRTWRREGRTLNHIVDPATSQPVGTTWRSVSVVAPTCAEANALSTGALVESTRAVDWLRQRGRPARLVARDGQVVLVGGWPEERAA